MKRYFVSLISILLLWASFGVFAQTSPNFFFNFGSLGSDLGQLNNPYGIATSSNGNIYILEAENHRVSVFNNSGAFLFAWGELGAGNGQFNSPTSIFIDSNDRVYVASDSSTIQVFDANGQFITKFGEYGSNPGQLYGIMDIAVDITGRILVSDQSSDSISFFDSNYNFLYRFGNFLTYDAPAGIAFASSGNIYVVDQSLARVVVFDRDGTKLFDFGEYGTNAGQFQVPTSIAIDSNDNVYITDFLNKRVQVFDLQGQFIQQFGCCGSGAGQFTNPYDIVYEASSARLYIADISLDRISVFQVPQSNTPPNATNDSLTVTAGKTGTVNLPANDFDIDGNLDGNSLTIVSSPDHGQLAAQGNGVYAYTPDLGYDGPDSFSYQICDTANACDTAVVTIIVNPSTPPPPPPTFAFSFGQYGQVEPGTFDVVRSIVVSSQNQIYAADNGTAENKRVSIFSQTGSFLFDFGTIGGGIGQFNSPSKMAIDAQDRIYVSDDSSHNVEVFDSAGNFLFQFGEYGSAEHQLLGQNGLAIDNSLERIYITDASRPSVGVFDLTGNFLFRIRDSQRLLTPTSIALDSAGNLYIADLFFYRIAVFDSNGNFLFSFGQPGTLNGQFDLPVGIAIDSNDYIYVADRTDRVQVFNNQGEYISQFGGTGGGDGQFEIISAMFYHEQTNRLYISDEWLDRIQVFDVGRQNPPIAPVANDDTVSLDENTSISISAGANDTDADNNLQLGSANIQTLPANGLLLNSGNGFFTYTPNLNFSGSDSFTYTICDADFLCDTATVFITVNPVNTNTAPTANSQSIISQEDNTISIRLAGSDAESTISFELLSLPQFGTLSGTAPDLSYTPNTNFSGNDSFSFNVSDGELESAPATVSINVIPVDDAPLADNQSLHTAEDTSLSVVLTGSDVEGSPLSFAVQTAPANGTLSGTPPNLVYTPNSNFFGLDSFTFVSNDGGLSSAPATVAMQVNPVNDAPIANSLSLSTHEDTALSLSLSGLDVDGDLLSYTLLGSPSFGVLSGTAPNLVYTPNANYFGIDSFSFKVNDGFLDSASTQVVIQVVSVNDAPSCSLAGPSVDFIWPAQGQLVSVTIHGMSDIEGDAITVRVDSIFQDEPVSSGGDQNPDGSGIGMSSATVRGERDGNGNGRIYHIRFTAADTVGATCSGEVLVGVRHDQGSKGQAVDDGAIYDSTIP